MGYFNIKNNINNTGITNTQKITRLQLKQTGY
jgi:hypothetical protein